MYFLTRSWKSTSNFASGFVACACARTSDEPAHKPSSADAINARPRLAIRPSSTGESFKECAHHKFPTPNAQLPKDFQRPTSNSQFADGAEVWELGVGN